MKNVMKGFVTGVIVTVMATNIVFANGSLHTVEVIFNKMIVKVNGIEMNADNILYNGTTYVPIRKVAEALGKTVIWEGENNTVKINDIKDDSLFSIEDLPSVPETIKIGNDECSLHTSLSRDFMPGLSSPGGSPLKASIEVRNKDNVDMSSSLLIDYIWVINGQEVWETILMDEDEGPLKRMTARNGPKWDPKIYVDVVVHIIDQNKNEYFLKASNQYIRRLS